MSRLFLSALQVLFKRLPVFGQVPNLVSCSHQFEHQKKQGRGSLWESCGTSKGLPLFWEAFFLSLALPTLGWELICILLWGLAFRGPRERSLERLEVCI